MIHRDCPVAGKHMGVAVNYCWNLFRNSPLLQLNRHSVPLPKPYQSGQTTLEAWL